MDTSRKLYRVKEGRMVTGVCTGLAKYWDVDLTLARVLFIILTGFSGIGLLLYVALIILMPPEPPELMGRNNTAPPPQT